MDPVKTDFRNFLFLMWRVLRLPAPTPVQYDIGDYLQHGDRRRMVEAFRGVGKSWITAAFVLWCLYCNPNERILVVSASKDRADAFSTFVKRMIAEWDLLAHLRPDGELRDSNVAFDVGGSMPHQSPSVRSVGVTGQMTGGRASKIIADDIETPKNSLTQTMRDRLAELVKEFDAILMAEEDLKVLGIDSADIIYLGTPQTEMSLYNALPERGYDVRVWPSRAPASAEPYKGRIAPMILPLVGKTVAGTTRGIPTDPARFHDLDLLEREASYGRSGFALQFQLDTSISDADRHPLRLSDLMVMGVGDQAPVSVAWGSSPDLIRQDLASVGLTGDRWFSPMFRHERAEAFQGVCLAIDPSGRGSDETGYAVVAMLYGYLWLLDAGGFKGGYEDETLQALANIAKRWKATYCIIESNFGDGMFTKLITPYFVRTHPVTTEEVRSSVQKEKRIVDTLEPVMNQHRLIVNEAVVKKDIETDEPRFQLFYQMTRITRDKGSITKDDRLDATAMAVAYWVEQMDRDTRSIEDDIKRQLLDEELERFAEASLGVSLHRGDNWFSTNGAFR